jgi:hypothetical protein
VVVDLGGWCDGGSDEVPLFIIIIIILVISIIIISTFTRIMVILGRDR